MYGGRAVVLGLDFEEKPNVVKDFIAKSGINYPNAIINDGLSQLYGDIEGIPTTFVIDQSGMILKVFVGSIMAEDLKPYIK